MIINSKDIDYQDYTYTIDLSNAGGLIVERRFALKGAETVSIRVRIDSKENSDLAKINTASIQRAIEILQSFLPKEA